MIDARSSNVRSISAFCEGGSGDEDGRTRFHNSFPKATVNRMGRIVNVYKNESKHTAKPKAIIFER